MTTRILRALGLFLVLSTLCCVGPACGQAMTFTPPTTERTETPLNGPWKFMDDTLEPGVEQPGYDDSGWATVAVPHTWNSRTNMVTSADAWYRCHFPLGAADRGHEIYISFDGAATVADVYLNGVRLGQHRGAYTRFLFDGTHAARFGGDNVLAVKVDNDPLDTADCLPSGIGNQLYYVYGGLYRPVHLLETAPVHVDPTDHAASGLYLTPENVSADSADVQMKTLVRNDGAAPQSVTVRDTVCDPDGQIVATATGSVSVGPGTGESVTLGAHIPQPRLWAPGSPALYHVYTETLINGQVTDVVAERTGLRFFRMTPTGFWLNGVLTPLRGVAKHQETEERATALTDADLVRDWNGLQDLGVNYVRLPHYPHAAREYDLADERGIVVWAENGHSNSDRPTATGEEITREMVRQNYNHPSILFWSAGNEAIYYYADIGTIEDYADIIRQEDPTRLVTYASNTLYASDPTLDFVAANRYNGWYGGLTWDFGIEARKYHWISETGAGGVVTIHTNALDPTHTVNKFEPEEYQQYVAEARCQEIFRDLSDEVPLFTWWIFRDFADPRYKGYNAKGLETVAGFKKDSYYLFQSFLRPQTPIVHLCGKTWFLRRGQTGTGLKAYANVPALTLTLNGAVVGTRRNGEYRQFNKHSVENVFYWDAPKTPGKYRVTVDDGLGHSDSALLYFEGVHGEAGKPDSSEWLQDVRAGNRANPARFIDQPVQPEWPVYDDFDGTGDNTYHDIPALLAGAREIATRRPSRPTTETGLSFTVSPAAGPLDVFVLCTASPLPPSFLMDAGFTDTGVTGTWRDNTMTLVPDALYRKTVPAGTRVYLAPGLLDYIVLVKPATTTLSRSSQVPKSRRLGTIGKDMPAKSLRSQPLPPMYTNGIARARIGAIPWEFIPRRSSLPKRKYR